MEHRDGKDKPVRETKLKRKNVKTKGKFHKNTRINLEKLYFYRRNVKKFEKASRLMGVERKRNYKYNMFNH